MSVFFLSRSYNRTNFCLTSVQKHNFFSSLQTCEYRVRAASRRVGGCVWVAVGFGCGVDSPVACRILVFWWSCRIALCRTADGRAFVRPPPLRAAHPPPPRMGRCPHPAPHVTAEQGAHALALLEVLHGRLLDVQLQRTVCPSAVRSADGILGRGRGAGAAGTLGRVPDPRVRRGDSNGGSVPNREPRGVFRFTIRQSFAGGPSDFSPPPQRQTF